MWDGLVVPELLRDEDNARQPHGSPVILERLATLAAAPEYRSDVLMVSDANENAHAPCWGFPLDETGGAAGVEGEAEPDEAARRPDLQARVTLEYVLAIVLRTTTSMQIKSFLLMIVGVLALHSNLSTEMWEVFRMLGALFSKPVVEAFCDLVDEKLRVDPVSTNANTRLVVKDNCAYRVNTKFVHADAAGETLQTVNWLSVPIPGDLFPTNIKRWGVATSWKGQVSHAQQVQPRQPSDQSLCGPNVACNDECGCRCRHHLTTIDRCQARAQCVRVRAARRGCWNGQDSGHRHGELSYQAYVCPQGSERYQWAHCT